MAAYAIISGFKSTEKGDFGEEVSRGSPVEMKKKLNELASKESPFALLEVVHSRRGRIARRWPEKVKERDSLRKKRARERAAAEKAEAEAKKAAAINSLEADLALLKGVSETEEAQQVSKAKKAKK